MNESYIPTAVFTGRGKAIKLRQKYLVEKLRLRWDLNVSFSAEKLDMLLILESI